MLVLLAIVAVRDTPKLSLAITCQSPTRASNFDAALPTARSHDFG
jgi:hypothetical protein